MKKYKAIFFDWDGTAVVSRKAPVHEVVAPMKKLLRQGVKLVIVSGTTEENIAEGELGKYFEEEELQNLYMGLGRGAYNYGFTKEKVPELRNSMIPDIKEKLAIHKTCYEIHEELLEKYGLNTDIVFSRPNYCKIDLMVELNRNDQLFLQPDEIGRMNELLQRHHYQNGITGLIDLVHQKGKEHGIQLKVSTDAKYLEAGISLKSDNVDYFMEHIIKPSGIRAEECCFWGDEFTFLGDGIPGSDAYMITELTKGADFFDVSPVEMNLPEEVNYVGGSVESFIKFLGNQSQAI